MEPLSLTAGAIATLVLTKAIEKTGEKLGEKVLEKGGELMELLNLKSPDTASAIEMAAQHPELAAQQPESYGIPVLAKKIQNAAESDDEIDAAVQSLANLVKAQPQSAQSIMTFAEKVGFIAPGSVFMGDIHF